jgi:hypothetical protein
MSISIRGKCDFKMAIRSHWETTQKIMKLVLAFWVANWNIQAMEIIPMITV